MIPIRFWGIYFILLKKEKNDEEFSQNMPTLHFLTITRCYSLDSKRGVFDKHSTNTPLLAEC